MIKGDFSISDKRAAKAFLDHAPYENMTTSVNNTSHKCRKMVSMWVYKIEVAKLETTQYNNKIIFVKFPELMSKVAVNRINAVTELAYGRRIFAYHSSGSNHSVKANEQYTLEFDKWYALDLFININNKELIQ